MPKLEKELFTELAKIREKLPGAKPKGRFWFSHRQREILDNNGRDRLYFKREDGAILEFTEMIEAADLGEYPALAPIDFPDAVLLGDGEFFGRAET